VGLLIKPVAGDTDAMNSETVKNRPRLPRLLLTLVMLALGLLSLSLLSAQLDPMLLKGYGFLTLSTGALLALHHSLIH
jgi:hypothetical protein